MWMNQAEIEWAYQQRHACPNVRKGIKLLYRLMTAINEQSDGWAYWSAGSKSADKLSELLKTAGNLTHGTSGTITADALKKAITPIRRMVTVQTEKQKQFGNTFTFDVDAALRD
jgi:hypothetical protein